MKYDPALAEIRFGCGLSPRKEPPQTAEQMLAGLSVPDDMARAYPIEKFETFRLRMIELRKVTKQEAKAKGTAKAKEFRDRKTDIRKQARRDMAGWFGMIVNRWVHTETAFRERLVAFWTDHFTAVGKMGVLPRAGSPYSEEVIRPRLTGTFADMLIAVTTHPLMLHYLDQNFSIGPDSVFAGKNRRLKGLNENLAREVLELHTLGVDGPYTQTDVRQLAELFTGLSYSSRDGFMFRPQFAQPGTETVLGQEYGGDPAKLDHVIEVLHDLAVHPATARHIAQKLAVHFVSDTPDPDLVSHLEARFLETGGDLAAVYEAMLEHPASWSPELSNVKPPFDFVASSCRALVVSPDRISGFKEKALRRRFVQPLYLMGQNWQKPGGPDGWPEEDDAWITPQTLSARLRWSMAVPRTLRPDLPDPRIFVEQALGGFAPEPVRFAAKAAETRHEAIGLVLSSPAFQRR